MGFPRYKDGAGYEHDQAPELMIGWSQGKGTVDELVKDQACPGSRQGEADDAVVVHLKF